MSFFHRFLRSTIVITVTLTLFSLFSGGNALNAQTKAQSETAKTLGLGSASLFESGYAPIILAPTTIRPGVPFNVKPTMDSLVSSSSSSMGGILNRFDTSKFGQFFNNSTSTVGNVTIERPTKSTKGAVAVQPSTAPKIYPPRLEMDYGEFPQTDISDPTIKKRINEHLQGILNRHPLTSPEEQVILVFQGRDLILRGKVESAYLADLLAISMGMEPGVDSVQNELEIIGQQQEEKILLDSQ